MTSPTLRDLRLLAAALAIGTASPVFAAMAADASSPPSAAKSECPTDFQPGPGRMHRGPDNYGMMGRESAREMGMMQNMMGMMSARSGMMGSHMEGRLASLKAELKITEAQTKLWDAFVVAVRSSAESMNGMYGQMMKNGSAASLPERLQLMDTQMSAHLANLENMKQALDPLYASFSPEQKKHADRTMIGTMGMM